MTKTNTHKSVETSILTALDALATTVTNADYDDEFSNELVRHRSMFFPGETTSLLSGDQNKFTYKT